LRTVKEHSSQSTDVHLCDARVLRVLDEAHGVSQSFVGANSYWLPLLTTQHDVELTLSSMQATGVKVLRTWGFNAINTTELPGARQSGLTYYQLWNNDDWELNEVRTMVSLSSDSVLITLHRDLKVLSDSTT
jgi:hypothetical protein